ncbi:protein FAM177A1-like isoform X2 [Macrosteles quadrilineatus]|uniref:protein FAM177A1-like n=1 Tax=Macrosteles quadrilineatus TaxID=74068 RepID=UPI0023E2D703|nr:protein FAM177A1-like [Macrosteles quadrilineatus]XP_054265363.1 protein FAM177A1-like isoform X2 [Macrosteles quadrilineatus]
MSSDTLTVQVPADDSSAPPFAKPKRVPRRVLHFSDGTLEEYSTDEEDGVEPKIVQQNAQQLSSVDPKTLAWMPWFWYQTVVAGSKTLEVCDYLGESLASFFGITTPKYQFEIDHYQQMLAEEEELKKKQDLEMGGWVGKNTENGEEENKGSITKAPSIQRLTV